MQSMRTGILSIAAALGALTACAPSSSDSGPDTDRGRQAIQRMSDRVGAAASFSVTTEEQRIRTRESGKSEPRSLIRRTLVRRNPDRFYFQTSGDVDNQGWYDGVGITLVMNNDKVFAQARMPET